MTKLAWGFLFTSLLGCEPSNATNSESAYSTFTIQWVGEFGPGFGYASFESFAFDAKTKDVFLRGRSPKSDPPSGRLYGQYVTDNFFEYNPDDSLEPCDPTQVASRTLALQRNYFPYDTVRLRSVRIDTATSRVPAGPLGTVCYALHTPNGWKWNLAPQPTFVVDRVVPAGGAFGSPIHFGHLDFAIGEEVTDQIAFTGTFPEGGVFIKLTYEAAPE